jgi:hypothetical protein
MIVSFVSASSARFPDDEWSAGGSTRSASFFRASQRRFFVALRYGRDSAVSGAADARSTRPIWRASEQIVWRNACRC